MQRETALNSQTLTIQKLKEEVKRLTKELEEEKKKTPLPTNSKRTKTDKGNGSPPIDHQIKQIALKNGN